tara:strand:+ start:129 stop:1547 length:1419 start_codon:yes stop_codon:yes gene_type:complete
MGIALSLKNRGLIPNSNVVSTRPLRTVPFSVNTTPKSYSAMNVGGMSMGAANPGGQYSLLNPMGANPGGRFSALNTIGMGANAPGGNLAPTSMRNQNTFAAGMEQSGKNMYAKPAFKTAQNKPNVPPNQLGQNLLDFATSGRGGAFAQGLLDKSGYSTMPVSFGEALASGYKSLNEFDKTTREQEFEKEKFEYLKTQDAIANAIAIQKNLAEGKGETANIKDFNFYKNLSEKDKETWDKIDKNNPELAAMIAGAVTAAEQGTDNVVSPGQLAFDKSAGTSLSKFVIEELPQQLANIDKIDDVIAIMKTQEVTGPVEGGTPFALKLFTNPESIGVEDDIRSIIYQSLRATLGAQFTEKEGERLVAATFNKYLSEEVNIKRLERLREETVRGLDTKSEMYNYLQEKGTLQGWEGPELLTGSKYKENKSSLQQSLFDVSDYEGLDSDQLLEIYESDISKEEKLFIYNNLEALGIS